jgi:hypothetical protein
MSRLSLSLALLLVVPSAACVHHADDPDVSAALELPSGGLDTTDEAPAFAADTELADAAIEGDAAAVDTLATDPATGALDRASAGRGHTFMVLWGKLPADRAAQDVRDWTGSLQISRGGLVVRRTVGFEDRTDHLVPRTALDTVSFASMTKPFVDGLVLTALDPAAATAREPLTLTYTPADGSTPYTLDLSRLAAGRIVVDAGDGFKIIAVGHQRAAQPCDRGFMRGRWHAVARNQGRFLGVVASEDGESVGHVRGIYGQRGTGEPVLFAKFIDRAGQFRGILAGTFGDGEYRARWITRQGDHGTANGTYFEGATPAGGGFLGRWSEAGCPTAAP